MSDCGGGDCCGDFGGDSSGDILTGHFPSNHDCGSGTNGYYDRGSYCGGCFGSDERTWESFRTLECYSVTQSFTLTFYRRIIKRIRLQLFSIFLQRWHSTVESYWKFTIPGKPPKLCDLRATSEEEKRKRRSRRREFKPKVLKLKRPEKLSLMVR